MKRSLLALAFCVSFTAFSTLATTGCSSSEDDTASSGAAVTDMDTSEALFQKAVTLARVDPADCEAEGADTASILANLAYAKDLAKKEGASTWPNLRVRMSEHSDLRAVVGTDPIFWNIVDRFDDSRRSLEKLLESGVKLRFYGQNGVEESFELTYGSDTRDEPPAWATLVKPDGVYGGPYTISDTGERIRIEFHPDQTSDSAAMTFEFYRHMPDPDPEVFSYRLEVVKAEEGGELRNFDNFPTTCRPGQRMTRQ